MSKLRHLKESKIVPQERYLPPWKHTPGIHRGYNIFFLSRPHYCPYKWSQNISWFLFIKIYFFIINADLLKP